MENIPEEYLDRDGDINLIDKNLTKIPKEIKDIEIWEKDYWCNDNQLTSLKGVPQKVLGGFSCSDNEHLTSLEYMPNYIGGDFYCYYTNNLIVILPICLSMIDGSWFYDDNPKDLKKAFEIIQKIHRQFGAGYDTLQKAKTKLKEAGLEKFCFETQEELNNSKNKRTTMIDIGSKWQNEKGQAIIVIDSTDVSYLDNPNEKIRVLDCVVFRDEKGKTGVMTPTALLENFIPFLPVYEYQFAYYQNGINISRHMTEDEWYKDFSWAYGGKNHQRLDFTKRERELF